MDLGVDIFSLPHLSSQGLSNLKRIPKSWHWGSVSLAPGPPERSKQMGEDAKELRRARREIALPMETLF